MKYFRKQFIISLLYLSFCGTAASGQAQHRWQFEFLPGIGKALPSPVLIEQEGHEDLQFWGSFRTRSLELPIYYSYRLSRYEKERGWEVELNHLKLYMTDRPVEVESFSITHGCNHLWVNRAFAREQYWLKFGAGIVIAHAENTVRGKKLEENKGVWGSGYYISGPSVVGGVQRNFPVSRHLFIPVEAKISLTRVRIPIVDGHASLPVVAFHFLTGLGVSHKDLRLFGK